MDAEVFMYSQEKATRTLLQLSTVMLGIEYASGETDPGETPDGGYEVDAAGAAQG